MRILHLPLPQLRALARACPDLLEAITFVVQEGVDPSLRVLRVVPAGERPRWYIAVGKQTLVVDSSDLAAMAAAVPILLVDVVADIRAELAPLFADGAMQAEIDKLIPFGPGWRNGGPPS